MPNLKFSRRTFVFSALALAGCQTTGMTGSADRVFTNAYDGNYEIYIGRIYRDTEFNRKNTAYNVADENELARLKVRCVGGIFSLIDFKEYTEAGPDFNDFEATIDLNGELLLTTTVNVLFYRRSTTKLLF